MKLIAPRPFDPAKVTTNVALTETAWTAGTYTLGTRRYDSATFDLYEVVVASTDDIPTVGFAKDVKTWDRVGKVNRFACFDGVIGNATSGSDIDMTIAPDGTVTTAIAMFDTSGGTVRVRALEPSTATNLFTNPEDFTDAAWSKNAATVNANTVAAPDILDVPATVTADTLIGTNSAENYMLERALTDVADGQTYGFSIFAKRANRNNVRFRILGGVAPVVVQANLLTGAGGTDVGGGWYRLSASATAAPLKNLATGVSDGAASSPWVASLSASGVTATKVGFGILDDGRDYVDYNIVGTASGANFDGLLTSVTNSFPAVSGVSLTAGFDVALIGGTTAGLAGVRAIVQGFNASNVSTENTIGNLVLPTSTAASSTSSRTLSNANTVTARGFIRLAMNVGSAIDVTLRFIGFQFEQGLSRTDYQHNFGFVANTSPVMPLVMAVSVAPQNGTTGNVHLWGAQAELGAVRPYRFETLYDRTVQLVDNTGIGSWSDWYFMPIIPSPDIVLIDLPQYGSSFIRVNVSGTARIGEMVVGRVTDIGVAAFGTQVGILDFSRKDRDTFGNSILIQRSFAKRVQYSVHVPTGLVAYSSRILSERRALPTVFIGDENRPETIAYGFFRDFTITLAGPSASECSIEVEGLT